MRVDACVLGLALSSALPSPAVAQLPAPALAPAGPSGAAPDGVNEASVAALLLDVRRIIDAEAGGGWLLEDAAQDSIHPVIMESVCRAAPEVRAAALRELAQERETLGDPRALYAAAGGELTAEVEAALNANRRHTALQRGIDSAPRECPFWVRAEVDFRGRQSMRDRIVVNFDTGGTAQLRHTQGSWSLGAGGFGRLLAGYGFTHVSVLAGIEFGGGAMLEPNTRPTEFVINYLPALPLLVRLHRNAWNLDLELAPVGLFQAGNLALSYGVRSGVTLGVSALRLRGILPWVGLGVAAEHHFGNSARPEAWYLRGGLRVGGVWDP